MRTFRDAKAMAKAMRAALAARKLEVSHSEALEIVAQQFGVDNWNILSARIEAGGQDTIAFEQAVPIVRIFDIAKAHEFYLGFLGFKVDWEHRSRRTCRSMRRSRAVNSSCIFPSMWATLILAATWWSG